MNPQALIAKIWSNKHTSIAACCYVGAKALVKLGEIWIPDYKPQFEQTGDLVESLAVGYGFIMAGDGKQTKQEPETKQ